MAIIIPVNTGVSVGTGVTTYSGLVATIGDWLERSDLGDKIPDFIKLLEARLNRILRVPQMEETDTLSTTGERIDLPVDFLQARALYLDTDPRSELHQMSLGALRTSYAVQATGRPEVFAITGSELVFGPAPDDEYDAILTYYTKIAALSASNETNWLIVSHPDIYLYGTLTMAEAFLWNDERVGMWKGAFDEALSELTQAGKRHQYSAAPLRLRPTVHE